MQKNSQGKYLVFIDDDAYPKDNWLETAQKNYSVIIMIKIVLGGPGILCEDENFGKCIDLFLLQIISIAIVIDTNHWQKMNKQQMDDWPSVNFIISKKFFEDLKGFDEIYWPGETQNCVKKFR